MGQAKRKSKSADAALSGLDRAALQVMAEAGDEIRRCELALKKGQSNIVGELLRGHETFFEWDHYPPGDAVDWQTHSQYYYHAHPKGGRPGEHGHFHTFMRYDGISADLAPLPLAVPQADNDDRIGAHLIAISMDKKGFPIALFTVNRWVTDETWYGADDLIAMLDDYEIDHTHPSWATNRWLGAMFRLFRPDIEEMIRARDARVAAYCGEATERDGGEIDDVYEDRGLEITSYRNISIDQQITAVQTALEKLA